MAGLRTPVVIIPQYVSYLGTQGFFTQPIAVAAFSAITLNLWVGAFIGTSTPSATFTLEESNDAETFFQCDGSLPSILIASTAPPPTQAQLVATLTRAWMRLFVGLTGVNAGVTCWAAGFFERRER